uniref:G_PROTEIN_RECEP_F1_2 domain-containing protein n=1 Tax=Heterorhabditis bacteriophora TaxID=37862 RepID=A0A1I7WCK9_HETBA
MCDTSTIPYFLIHRSLVEESTLITSINFLSNVFLRAVRWQIAGLCDAIAIVTYCTRGYIRCIWWAHNFTLLPFVYYADAQALNDPITQYIEGRLGNRRIFWCPSGYEKLLLIKREQVIILVGSSNFAVHLAFLGYLAYCPQPTDWDNYNWCCTWPYMGSWKPSCCPFAIPTGAVVAIIIASIVLVADEEKANYLE